MKKTNVSWNFSVPKNCIGRNQYNSVSNYLSIKIKKDSISKSIDITCNIGS